MPVEHFTRDDVIGVALGIVLFAPFLFSPGFVLGWLLDLLEFRSRPLVWRVIFSIPLSIALSPILNFLVGSYLPPSALWIFYAAAAAGLIAILWFDRRRGPAEAPPPKSLLWGPLAWAAIVLLSGIDVQWGNRLYPSVLVFDFNIRTAFIDSITRHGLPAVNPLFYPGHFVPLRYHYFWFISCSLVDRLGGDLVSPRHALIASDVWCGWGIMSLIAIYLRVFHPAGQRAIWQRVGWGIALCAVGGLDIIPTLLLDLFYWCTGAGWTPQSVEIWNKPGPIASFAHSTLWVAHHVAALVAGFTGFLIAFRVPRPDSLRRALPLAAAALALASSAGLSAHVTFVLAVSLVAWAVYLICRKDLIPAAWLSAVGLLAIAVSLPYLAALRSVGGSNGALLSWTIRAFYPVNLLLPAFGYTWNQIAVANLLLLPLNYFLEAGVWVVMGILVVRRYCRRSRHPQAECAAALIFVSTLLVCNLLRSSLITNNDLGTEGIMVAEFILLIWSVDCFRAWWRLWRRAAAPHRPALRRWTRRVAVLACLGVISVAADVFLLRTYFLFDDLTWLAQVKEMDALDPLSLRRPEPSSIGVRSFAMRQIYSELQRATASDAIVQGHPNRWNDLYHGLYSSRQDVAFDPYCGTVFGGNPQECEPLQSGLTPLFSDPTAANRIAIDDLCDQLHIAVLVVNDVDPVFRSKQSWVWRRTPLLASPMVRAFSCGSAAGAKNADGIWVSKR